MKNFFNNIWNFLKNPRVKLWFCLMGVVVIVSVSIFSIVMIVSTVGYSNKLKPELANVYNIVVRNDCFGKERTVDNVYINGEHDTDGNQNKGLVVKTILEKLQKSAGTTRFEQLFMGAAGGAETVVYETSSTAYLGNTYIGINFVNPMYVITRGDNRQYLVSDFDTAYSGSDSSNYNNYSVVNAIYIGLDASKGFTEQTWYISLGGSQLPSGSKYLNYQFKTYGNYYDLYKYILGLDDVSLS